MATKWIRVVFATCKSFIEDDCYNKASSLTFYTVQSIIPFFAFILGIAKGFGFDNYLEEISKKVFHEQREIVTHALEIAKATLQHIQGGLVVGVGIAFLLWTSLNLIQYIETAFSEIWKTKNRKNPVQKYAEYLAILILCPIIVVISSSLTLFVKSQLLQLEYNSSFQTVGTFLLTFFKLLPWVLSWIVFFFFYYLVPSSNRKIWTKVVGAIFAGTLFQLWQVLYIALQVKVFSYNVVYGAFASIPLFLLWLQFSWLIALAGAELAAHLENDYFPGRHSKKIDNRQLGFLIIYHCFKSFQSCNLPLTEDDLAKRLRIPVNLIQKMVNILVEGNVLAEVRTQKNRLGYHPLCNAHCFTLKQVSEVIEKSQDLGAKTDSTSALKVVTETLEKFDEDAKNSQANIRLDEWFDREPLTRDCDL